jgi:hypothetical protein
MLPSPAAQNSTQSDIRAANGGAPFLAALQQRNPLEAPRPRTPGSRTGVNAQPDE